MAAADPFDIVVMSFGAFFENDDPGLFAGELTSVLGNALAVAAAGNDMSCRPYYPAAIPGVIAVGPLAADGKAWFTNFGDWVDAWCASSRRSQHVLPRLHREDRRDSTSHLRRMGTLERYELRRPEGGGSAC